MNGFALSLPILTHPNGLCSWKPIALVAIKALAQTPGGMEMRSEGMQQMIDGRVTLKTRLRLCVGGNIKRSIELLQANRHHFPHSNYGQRYLDVCWQLIGTWESPRVLHMGCGRDRSGLTAQRRAASGARFVGVDIDFDSLKEYPLVDRVLADLAALPFCDGAFDLAMCEEVFEHIERPHSVVAEAARVLARGGKLVFATPSKLGYISLISWATPLWFHRMVQNLLNPGRNEGELLFATFYRLNTPWAVERVMRNHGFRRELLEMTEPWPWMLRLHPLLVRLGILWGRLVQRLNVLQPLRNRILGVYSKQS